MKKMFASLCVSLMMATSAYAIETEAVQAYLVDAKTGAVLFEKEADVLMAPSSMTKILTAYVVFQRLKNGSITLNTELPVSEKAWRTGGSKMFVKVGDTVRVEDLLKGLVVQSGNDACIVLAEGLAGSEEAFADEMNRVAHEMGAKGVTFYNVTGLPHDDHKCTAKDLALIAQRTLEDFPEEYKAYYPMTEFTYNNITQPNRNPLLAKGADGLKTGFTDAGGYGLVGSTQQGDRRLIMVINGLKSMKERASESAKVMSWGFAHFDNIKVAKKGEPVELADVWGGAKGQVSLVTDEDAVLTIPKHQERNLVAKVVYDGPIQAPVAKGTEVGKLVVEVEGKPEKVFPLKVAEDVEEAGFFKRISNSIHYLFSGKSKA